MILIKNLFSKKKKKTKNYTFVTTTVPAIEKQIREKNQLCHFYSKIPLKNS
jgi:hypothetical protein